MKYFPVLRGRDGDLNALRDLPLRLKKNIAPIVEVLADGLGKAEELISDYWAFDDNQILIDPKYAVGDLAGVRTLFRNLNGAGVSCIPVIAFDSDRGYLSFVKRFIASTNSTVCIRITDTTDFVNEIVALTAQLDVSRNRIILVFDLGLVTRLDYDQKAKDVIADIIGLPNNKQYSDIVVAGGSFPDSLKTFAAGTKTSVPRYEWLLWEEIQKSAVKSIVTYSDYGIRHPIFNPASKAFSPSASIKYTTEKVFLIFRGTRPSKKKGPSQYHQKSKEVVADALYDKDFSWADKEIEECSLRTIKPGGSGKWVTIFQNRHISKVYSLL